VKILYISQYFPPEMGAPAARASELAWHWMRTGHEVTVLTGFPNHPTGIVPAEYRWAFRRLVARERKDGVRVMRTWLLPFPNRKAWERMLNYSSFCVSATIMGTFLEKPDVVIASSPQLLVGLSGWWISRLRGVPLIFEVRDLWPESLSAVGVGGEKSLLHRTLGRVAGFLYRNSQRIVIVSPAFRGVLTQRWGVPNEKIALVENGVETDLFRPQDANALRRELGLEGKFVVCYIGTMGMAHGLETLLDSAAALQISSPHVHFLLIGEGAEKARIQALAQSRGLSNMLFLDQQPREKIPAYISAADASLVLLKKTDLFKTVIPTKMLEFMACARPVVLAVDGQARKIVENAHAGIFVEPESSSGLCRAILGLAANPSLCRVLGLNGRQYIQQNLSRRRTAMDYLEICKELLGNASSQDKEKDKAA
jgi:glycosyltransferase involved in cell wall biosynthesis